MEQEQKQEHKNILNLELIKSIFKEKKIEYNKYNENLLNIILNNWDKMIELYQLTEFYDTHKNYHFIDSEPDSDSDDMVYTNSMDDIMLEFRDLINEIFFNRKSRDTRFLSGHY